MKRLLLLAVILAGCGKGSTNSPEAKAWYVAESAMLDRLESEKAEKVEKLRVRYKQLTDHLQTLGEGRIALEKLQEIGKDQAADMEKLNQSVKRSEEEQTRILQQMDELAADYDSRIVVSVASVAS